MATDEDRVLIAGAGIGGLTLAAALRHAGLECLVLERAPAFAPLGAGITVQPNGLRSLAPLGMDGAVVAAGEKLAELSIRHWRGATLSRMDGASFPRLFGAPAVAIHRAKLHAVLLSANGEVGVRLGFEVARFEEAATSVAVVARDGERLTGSLLVAADGLNSAVRAQLLGDGPPRYAGYTSWRGVTPPCDLVPAGATSESWGPGARFGIVPIGGGRVYWFATANAPAGGTDAGLETLLARFGEWHAPIAELLRATPAAAILRTDISDRPAAPRWSAGRVTLLGDAAHPMTPDLGQGGCQAIEDAVVLAGALSEARSAGEDLAAALLRYERRRAPRANRVVDQARRFGAVGQWSAGPLRGLRDLMVRLTSRGAVRTLNWLYAFEPSTLGTD